MKISIVGNRVGVGVVLTLSIVVLLMLLTTTATPAIAQSTRKCQGQQPGPAVISPLIPVISPNHHYAQSFCTGSVATTLDKVRLYTISKSTDPNALFYHGDPAPVVTIRSIDAWGKPGAVLHTLTNPVIDRFQGHRRGFHEQRF